jgi:hypothetical protein
MKHKNKKLYLKIFSKTDISNIVNIKNKYNNKEIINMINMPFSYNEKYTTLLAKLVILKHPINFINKIFKFYKENKI